MAKNIHASKLCRFNNKLVESKMDMHSAEELKIFSIVVSQVEMEDEDFKSYKVPLEKIEEISGKKKNESQIKRIAERMLKKTVFINEPTGWTGYSIFSKIRYIRGERCLEVSFHPDLKPYLLNLKDNFTKAKLHHIVHLSSGYAIRLFLLFKQYEVIGKREMELLFLHELLQTPLSYRRNFADFQKRVIAKSLDEINDKTDLFVTFEVSKKNAKKVESVLFTIVGAENVANEQAAAR